MKRADANLLAGLCCSLQRVSRVCPISARLAGPFRRERLRRPARIDVRSQERQDGSPARLQERGGPFRDDEDDGWNGKESGTRQGVLGVAAAEYPRLPGSGDSGGVREDYGAYIVCGFDSISRQRD
jgi:hypothetical protein